MARWIAPSSSRRVRYVLIAASVLGLIIGLDTLVLHLRLDPLADVRAYYDAGARLNAGLPLYEQPATTNDPGFYRYPPLLAVAFRPLALLPYETAALIWEALLIVLFVGTLVRLGLRNQWTWIVTAGWPHRSPGASPSARRRSRSRSCSRSGRRGRSRSPATSRSCRSSSSSSGSAGVTGARSGGSWPGSSG